MTNTSTTDHTPTCPCIVCRVRARQKRINERVRAREAKQADRIEAHGVKGMTSRPWRKTFRNADALLAWAEKHDAEIYATSDAD